MDRVDDRSPRARLDVAVEPLRGRPHPRMRTRRQPAKPAPTGPASVKQERVATLSLRGGTRAQSPETRTVLREIRPQTDGIPPSVKGAAGFSCQ
jgi:hypothetical protein